MKVFMINESIFINSLLTTIKKDID